MDSSDFPYFEVRQTLLLTKMANTPSILMRARKSWMALGALMLPFLLMAQGGIEVDGTVREKDSNRKLSGVEVEVLRGGQPYDAVSTLSNGKYTLSLEHGEDYELRFTFGDLSPRKVELNTSTIPASFRERPFYLTVEMSMFEVPDGFDMSLLDKPIGKVAFDASKEQLAWDLPYTATMQGKIDRALSAATESGGTEAEASNKEYDEHMRKAEVEFGRERWAQSINWLDRALTEVPGDARAEQMLADAQERQAAAEAEAASRREYEGQMREGKMAMRKEDWAGAIAAFEAAIELIPSEQEPRDLLAEVQEANAEVGDDQFVDEDYLEAMAEGEAALAESNFDLAEASFERASNLKPSERTPKEKLAEIRQLRKEAERSQTGNARQRKEYDALIEKADRNFDALDFVKAKSLYEQAAQLMPDEAYPRERAEEAGARIVPLGGAEEEPVVEVEADQANALDREYEDRIRAGDEAFDAELWTEAEDAYAAALELKPNERYPKNRLRRLQSMQTVDTGVDANLEIDREALKAEGEAEAEAVAQETAAIQEEQDRLLEEERLAAQEAESLKIEQSRASADADRDRSRNYVLAMQNREEDDAEAYYRDALESEIRARGQAVYAAADRQEALEEVWVSNSDTRRQSSYADIRESAEVQANATFDAASYRSDRRADLEVKVELQQEQAQDWQAKGNAGRRDRFITLTRKDQANRQSLHDRTKRYAVFVDSLDRMLATYADFNRDLRMASTDARIMRFEDIERRAAEHRRVGEGESIRRLDRWNGIQKVEREDQQAKTLAAGEAAIRSAAALRKEREKETGTAPTSEDFKEVPAKQGVREGVEERSYEEGNALIIERTVRVDNEVNVYRKTVAKHGVYYFKNNHSITRDIWVLETFEISD